MELNNIYDWMVSNPPDDANRNLWIGLLTTCYLSYKMTPFSYITFKRLNILYEMAETSGIVLPIHALELLEEVFKLDNKI